MSPRTWLVLLFAVMSGASAIIGITQMRATQAAKEIATVYMVKKAVARGYQLREEDVESRRIPSNLVHEAMAKSLDDVVGRVAKFSIVEGEYVLTTKLAEAGVKAGFATTIPSGLRAKSITAITAADRVSGLLNVGDHVDVLLTHATRNGSSDETSVTETLVQNVEVLAIDRTVESVSVQPKAGATDKGDTKPSSVTLLVTPREASILSLGQKEGALSLSLRSPEDQSIVADTDLLDSELHDAANPKKSNVPASLTSKGSRVATLKNTSYNGWRPGSGAIDDSDQYNYGQFSDMDDPLVMRDVALLVNSIPYDNPQSTKYSAIRTIRGSSVGAVPIQVKQSSR
jgi:pilus assembly protein CpaB